MDVEGVLELAGEPGNDVAGDVLTNRDTKPVGAIKGLPPQVQFEAVAHVGDEIAADVRGIDEPHPSTLPVS